MVWAGWELLRELHAQLEVERERESDARKKNVKGWETKLNSDINR